jgi:hypothetical protein
VLAFGAARGNGWPAREAGSNRALSRSLEWCRTNKQKIQLLKHGTEIGGNRDCDCVDLEKWPRFLSSAGPKSQNGKMNFNEVYQYSNSILSFNSTCVLRSENRHFVVALTWSLGRICATDWILKYTPTPSRLFQTTDTIHYS